MFSKHAKTIPPNLTQIGCSCHSLAEKEKFKTFTNNILNEKQLLFYIKNCITRSYCPSWTTWAKFMKQVQFREGMLTQLSFFF